MYTRCPSCEALYGLTPQELAEAAGIVRCSNCGKTFNSLARLFAVRPKSDDEPLRGKGMPPLLAGHIPEQGTLPGFSDEAPDPAPAPPKTIGDEDVAPQRPAFSARFFWPLGVALLALAALGQGAWLLDLPGQWLHADGSGAASNADEEAISLIGRDLHGHPSRDDAVVVSALLRNDSSQPVDFPRIELRLFDRSNQLLGVRRLHPAEYLPDPAREPDGLGPSTSLPIIIEVALTGSDPSGFDLRFF